MLSVLSLLREGHAGTIVCSSTDIQTILKGRCLIWRQKRIRQVILKCYLCVLKVVSVEVEFAVDDVCVVVDGRLIRATVIARAGQSTIWADANVTVLDLFGRCGTVN